MNIKTPESTDLPALLMLWQEAFGDTTEFINTFFQTAFDCNRCLCVTADGQVVAALYWFDCQYHDKPIAYLYAIATAKAYQGQGICHKLMEHTHNHLLGQGYAGAVLVPGSPALFEFYAKMGYKTCCFLREFCCNSTPKQLKMRPVTTTEYAALRKQLLPKDGIIQENICLDFLQTQAQLFAGSDFIMAAHMEGSKLFVPELLGDCSMTEQIVHTLGCTEGLFRTPGKEKPFAMYLPFQATTQPLPAYFGLAFD